MENAAKTANVMIKINEKAEDKDITLFIPQSIPSIDVKNSIISLFEYVVRIEYEDMKKKAAEEAAKKAEETKVEEPKVEIVS